MQRGCSSLKDLLWRHPTDKDVEAKIKDKENRVSRCTGASNKKVRKKFKSAADERKSATAERKSTSHSPSLSSIEWNAPDSLRGSTDFSVAEAMDYRYTDSESSRSNSMDGDGNGDGDDHHFAREEYSRMSYMDEEELFAEMWADDSSPAETGKESIDKPTIQMRSVAGKAPAPHGTLNPVLGL